MPERTGMPLSIAIFDIDNFKKVNDTKGHVIGDQVLLDLAAILDKVFADLITLADMVARNS